VRCQSVKIWQAKKLNEKNQFKNTSKNVKIPQCDDKNAHVKKGKNEKNEECRL
jgi:hypothetical protein